MPNSIRELMSTPLVKLRQSDSCAQAAKAMQTHDVGDVLVVDDKGQLAGILTDRDIVVRGIAEGLQPESTSCGALCTTEPVTISADDDSAHAIELMGRKAIRRLPVVEQGRLVGILSLGDLAVDRDRQSALGQISSAPPTA